MYFVWKEISILSSLPKLEVLKLIGCVFNDEEWELSEKEIFKQLTYLEIVTNMFKRWEARNKHFPNLQHLILVGCFKLEEIPVEFGEIVTLKLIKLKHCLPSVVNSAKQIMEEQHDQGNDNMFVIEEGTLKAQSPNLPAAHRAIALPPTASPPTALPPNLSPPTAVLGIAVSLLPAAGGEDRCGGPEALASAAEASPGT
nr:putative late blight resistance protein homolog R1B-16 isoform X1 [Ipomoea batatas]